MPETTPALLVALGASAGGLEPLEGFFKSLPSESNMAFFVIQHLSPDYKSLMDEILARHTSLKIKKVEENMVVEENTIYLIPSKKLMVIESGKLKLRDKTDEDQLSMPIDIFFKSLAAEASEQAVGIILSGSGTDGSRGVVDIRDGGGFVIAQEQLSAKFPSMPQSAIDTGVVDRILNVQEMYEVLVEYLKNPQAIRQVVSGKGKADGDVTDIVALLRESYNIDFNMYKTGTIDRRIERRMSLKQYHEVSKYYNLLLEDEGERNALYKDLLIGVTSFFRDPEAYAALEQLVLTDIISSAGTVTSEVRIWVVGCATGEEVYSLAIACGEIMRQKNMQLNLKFFATDVHRESLNFATVGIYHKSSLSGVSPELLERWFEQIDKENYQIQPELRKLIVFAEHDVLKDPPFTKINLLTCRNLLIYMQPVAQQKIISLFHFALQKNGNLFLGPSETLGELEDEFDVIDKHWKLFTKKRDVRLPAHLRFPLASTLGTANLVPGRMASGAIHIDQRLLRAYDSILEKYVSSGFLVNHYHELIHTFGSSRQVLLPPKGRASLDILTMVEGELKIALAAALQRAERERLLVTYKGIQTSVFADSDQASITVDPIPDKVSDSLYFFVMIKPMLAVVAPEEAQSSFDFNTESKKRIYTLEQEIQNLRENLQATVEELETSNEELQASNEELVASNEELQSTNEELHSVNEELYTVNAEYELKIQELSEMTSDLDNLLDSTEIGTIFLDAEFCIRKYTQTITKVFNVLPHDVGRPINHISNTIGLDSIMPILKGVTESGEIFTQEIKDKKDKWYLMRALPYWGETKEVEGIVVTFVDITSRKDEESERIHLTEQLHHSHKMKAIGTLAGGIAHEFNNLLQAISSQMELLAIDRDMKEEDKDSLNDVMRMTRRAKDLVKGILSFSHKSMAEKKPVDLNSILQTTLHMLEQTIPRNINLQIKTSANPVVIRADISQIQQIIFNLAANSRDAMKEGGDLVFSVGTTSLKEEEAKKYPTLNEGEYALLTVRDSGKGMDQEIAAEIFDPFFTTKDVGQGTGIGLSIVYGIVSSHHGHIECSSVIGSGTTFTLYFPLTEPGVVPEEVDSTYSSLSPVTFENVKGATILVVDDEGAIRRLSKKILERAGYTVLTAENGESAIEQYRQNHGMINLVILDMGMPGMGGEKCIAELRKINSKANIVIASGYLNHEYAVNPEKFGAVKFISKPFQVSELAAQVSKMLEDNS